MESRTRVGSVWIIDKKLLCTQNFEWNFNPICVITTKVFLSLKLSFLRSSIVRRWQYNHNKSKESKNSNIKRAQDRERDWPISLKSDTIKLLSREQLSQFQRKILNSFIAVDSFAPPTRLFVRVSPRKLVDNKQMVCPFLVVNLLLITDPFRDWNSKRVVGISA